LRNATREIRLHDRGGAGRRHYSTAALLDSDNYKGEEGLSRGTNYNVEYGPAAERSWKTCRCAPTLSERPAVDGTEFCAAWTELITSKARDPATHNTLNGADITDTVNGNLAF